MNASRAQHRPAGPLVPGRPRRQAGQATVEFALSIMVFLLMVVGLFDLGGGVYRYNAVSEAARDIARRTIVHTGITLGQSAETLDTVAVHRRLIPGMGAIAFTCVDAAGAANGHVPCTSGDYVRVTVSATYQPVTLLPIGGPITLSSTATMRIP